MRGRRNGGAIAGLRAIWMLAFVAPASLAAGLGELRVQSHINEPFEARVEVTGSADELEGARVTLEDAGAAGGITAGTREAYSATLLTGDGSPQILIRSRRRVAEPLLHLVLRLRAGAAQVQREYDVLLDLPEVPAAGATRQSPVPVRALSTQGDGPDAGAIIGDTAGRATNPSSAPSAAARPPTVAASSSSPVPARKPSGTRRSRPIETPPPAPGGQLSPPAPRSLPEASTPMAPALRVDEQLHAWSATATTPSAGAGGALTLRLDTRLATSPAAAVPETTTAAPAETPASAATPGTSPPVRQTTPSHWLFWLVVAVLVLLALWARRKRREDASAEEDFVAPDDAEELAASAPPAAVVVAPPRPVASDPELLADFQEPLRESMEVSDPGVGFYGEVAQLLLSALDRDPQRADLRLKLLEIFHDARETERFRLHAQRYRRQAPAGDDPHWPHIRTMGLELMPDEPLFASDSPVAKIVGSAGRPLRFYEYLEATALEEALRALAGEYRRLYLDGSFLGGLQQALAPLRPQPTPLDRLDDDEADAPAAGPVRLYGRWEPARAAADETETNAAGQVYIAHRLGRRAIVTATRASRHALAVAHAARARGLACRIHMRASDHRRHAQALEHLKQYPVDWVLTPDSADGDARTAALGDWLLTPDSAFYVSSTAAGPHPYPSMVRDLRALLGAETREQLIGLGEGPPLAVVVGRDGGGAALSVLQAFLDDRDTALYCVESVADGAVGEHQREHAWLRDTGRVRYTSGFMEGTTVVDTQIPGDDVRRMTPDSRSAATFARRLARGTDRQGAILVLLCGASQIDFEL